MKTKIVKVRVIKDYNCPGLGDSIKKKRKSNPKSVTDLASEAGMSVSNWYRIEAEKVEYLPKETLDAIMSALGEDEIDFSSF
jgi:transcriptional regulator with XRE-family HTH domain